MLNLLRTKLRKFRKIVIIFWSCFFDELQQMSLFIETERGGQFAAEGPLVCEAVHVSWVWDRLRSVHVLHSVRDSFGGHVSDLYSNFHRDLGRGLQKSSIAIWEVTIIKSLSFILGRKKNTTPFMIFSRHVCADSNFITFFSKLFMFLFPVDNNSTLILFIHLFDRNFRNFDRHMLRITFAINFQHFQGICLWKRTRLFAFCIEKISQAY